MYTCGFRGKSHKREYKNMKMFLVAFTAPDEELQDYRKANGEWDTSDESAFARILQRDLYDDMGMAGEFQVLSPSLTLKN